MSSRGVPLSRWTTGLALERLVYIEPIRAIRAISLARSRFEQEVDTVIDVMQGLNRLMRLVCLVYFVWGYFVQSLALPYD